MEIKPIKLNIIFLKILVPGNSYWMYATEVLSVSIINEIMCPTTKQRFSFLKHDAF